MMNEQIHTPVLLVETLECLKPQAGETYADMTAGYGGHAAEVLAITGNYAGSLLVDRDERAITALQDRFKDSGIQLRRTDFASASQDAGDSTYDMILADLGVSSLHLDQADRGFSFAHDGPLDMRMDQSKLLTAAELVNKSREEQLADILYRYGEEPKSRQIARLIVQHRPFKTTAELAAVVKKAWPGHSRVHPATRTFQALRIAVNDELGLLERALPDWIRMLKPGGRLAVISFHSLEDRIVKQFFQEHGGDRFDAELRLLTKRPIVAGPQESVSNPRARSAKLRAAVKTKN